MASTLTLEDMQHLSEEVRHLVRAGMPLEESLAAAGSGRGDRLQRLTQTISDELSHGRSLQEIVEQRTIGVPPMLASAVAAGVRSGDLGMTVEMMGDFAADVVALRNKLLQSAAYPLTIVAVAGLLVILVVQHALERFLETLLTWNIKANPLLMTFLEWNRDSPGWILIIPLSGLALLMFWTWSGRAASMTFRGPERLLLLLPGVGALVRDLRYYTLTRMLSLLTERGLPLQDALTLAGGASGSARLENACREMAACIQRGQSLSDETLSDGTLTAGTLSDGTLSGTSRRQRLPSLLHVCLKQVEHNEARMTHRLRSVAEFYRNRLQRNSAWVRLLMPIVLFVVIGGGCVLIYAVLVFWPVTELYRNLGMGS